MSSLLIGTGIAIACVALLILFVRRVTPKVPPGRICDECKTAPACRAYDRKTMLCGKCHAEWTGW